jgi:MYXO-CTERM domain-containing protein
MRAAVIPFCAVASIAFGPSVAQAQGVGQVRQDPAIVYVTASPSDRSTWMHEVKSGTGRYAIVALTLGQVMSQVPAGAAVTFGGRPMSLLGGVSNSDQVRVELWGLPDPAVGVQAIAVQLTRPGALVAGSLSFTGVNLPAATGTVATQTGAGSVASVTIASTTNEHVVDVYGSPEMVPTVGAGQTANWIDRNGISGASSSRPGGTGPAMSWDRSGGSSLWALAAVTLRAAPTSDGGAPGGGDAGTSPAGDGGSADSAGNDGAAGPMGDATTRQVEFQMGCSCDLEGHRSPGGPVALAIAFFALARSRRRRA